MADPQSAFQYTDTPTGYATPEQVAQLRGLANYNLTQIPQAKSWAGVLAHALGGFTGNRQMNQANQFQQEGIARGVEDRANIGQQSGGLLGSTPMAGNANAGGGGGIDPKQAVSYYTSQGLPPAAAAGLTGAFQAESGINPNISKVGDGRDGSPSSGIGQWNAKRAQNLLAYARMQGKSPNDPQVQLDFPLVEMGLKGNPGTPGYGTEAKSRQALMGAQTPQQATAAALMYERPAGYTDKNPMGAYSAQKRLALTNALMGGGGQGGQGGQPMQMAQASPTTNMNNRQYAALMGNPWIPQDEKNQYQHAQTPQTFSDATGGIHAMPPGQAPAGQLTPGIVSGNISTPNATVPVVQNTQNSQPVGQGAFTQGQPLTSTVKGAAELGNTAGETANDLDAVNKAKEGYLAANKNLGQIQSFRALGQDVDSGALPMWQTLAARFGVKFGSDAQLGRLQAYQAMAESILGGRDDGFKASIPGLSTTPEGRQYIADYLENQYRYAQEQGKIAFGSGTATERRLKMSQVPMPQSYTSQNGPPQGQGQPPSVPANSVNPNQPQAPQRPPAGSAAAATSSAPIKITDEAGYKALPKGKQYIAPDGSLRTKK